MRHSHPPSLPKATLMLAFIALLGSIAGLVGVLVGNLTWEGLSQAWPITLYSVSIAFYLLVMWGAIRFHRCAVALSVAWEIVALVLLCLATAEYNWSGLSEEDKIGYGVFVTVAMIWRLVVIYAESTFLSEIGKGIMSPQTHSREKYSCCCNV